MLSRGPRAQRAGFDDRGAPQGVQRRGPCRRKGR